MVTTMANENTKRSFHSIDHAGHIVPHGPLDERLRNIEARMEGGGHAAGLREEIAKAIKLQADLAKRVDPPWTAAHLEARLNEAIARIAKIEQAMELMCTAIHGTVPAHAGGYDGTIAFTFMRPDVVKVHHIRLADDSPTCLRITSIRCGMRQFDSDGNINEIVYPGGGVTVTVANSGLGIVNASVLVFYEEGNSMADALPTPFAKAYLSGHAAGEEALRRKGRV